MRILIFLLAMFLAAPALASEGGEGGGGNYVKLETFTVNIEASATRYLQANMVLKTANPAAGERIKEYMPLVRHEIILLISDQTAENLMSLEGKKKLMETIKHRVNEILHLDEKTGVEQVFFETFVVQ